MIALEDIVELWRETLAPEAARAAHRAASELPHDAWPAEPKALHAAWLARASAPSCRDVVELMRVFDFAAATAKQVLERLDRMTAWSPHPIATRWLVDVFARQTRAPLLDGQKCFRRVLNLLVTHIDIDGANRFESWIGTHPERIAASEYGAKFFDDGLRRVLAKSADRRAAARALDPAELAELADAKLLDEPPPKPREVTLDALLAAIYEAPWDDGPRLVLADFLQQRNDPRGELIAIDLVADPTPAQRKRRRELLAAHGKAWFPQALHRLVKRSAEYERGFLARGTLQRTDRTPIELSTFRELEVSGGGNPDFDHPVFRGIEAWTGLRLEESDIDDDRLLTCNPQPRVKRLGIATSFRVPPARIAEQLRPETWPALVELVVDTWIGTDAYAWNDPSVPTWIDDAVRVLAARLPQLERIAIAPFGVFDRDGQTTELFLPFAITKELVWDYEQPYLLEARGRWFSWLATRAVPIVVAAPAHQKPMAYRVRGIEIRIGKPRTLPPLPRGTT